MESQNRAEILVYRGSIACASPRYLAILGGFVGFGTYWILAIVTFILAQSKRRAGYFLLAPIVCFVGLSVFVNYMIARDEIRQLVWYQPGRN